jgi:hypothetical protein
MTYRRVRIPKAKSVSRYRYYLRMKQLAERRHAAEAGEHSTEDTVSRNSKDHSETRDRGDVRPSMESRIHRK